MVNQSLISRNVCVRECLSCSFVFNCLFVCCCCCCCCCIFVVFVVAFCVSSRRGGGGGRGGGVQVGWHSVALLVVFIGDGASLREAGGGILL